MDSPILDNQVIGNFYLRTSANRKPRYGKSNFFRNMTDKGFLLKQYNGEFYYQDIAVKEEDFCPVDSEERIPFEETDTDYKQLQLNMNQGIKGI